MAKLMSFSFETVRKQLVLHLSNKASYRNASIYSKIEAGTTSVNCSLPFLLDS